MPGEPRFIRLAQQSFGYRPETSSAPRAAGRAARACASGGQKKNSALHIPAARAGQASLPVASACRRVYPQLLELSVQVGTLQAGSLRYPRHAVVFLLQMVFEINTFELIAGITQRLIE